MAGLDAGRSRSMADYLAFEGYRNCTSIAGSAKVFAAIAAAQPKKSKGARMVPAATLSNRSEMLAYVRRFPGLQDVADWLVSRRNDVTGWVPLSILGGCVMAIREMVDKDWAVEFGDAFATGAGLTASSPVLKIRNRMMKASMDPRSRIPTGAQLVYVLKAWAYWVTDSESVRVPTIQTIDIPRVIGPDDSLSAMWVTAKSSKVNVTRARDRRQKARAEAT